MKRRPLLGFLASLALAHSFAVGGPQKKSSPPIKDKSVGTASAKSAKVKSGSSFRGKRSKGTRTTRSAPGPSYQLHPDPQRYSEIQRALADRGFFNGELNGEWKDDSVDALKRFQASQKLPDDGKISALTLAGLGLGPRHDGSTAVTVPLPTATSELSVSGSTVGPASSATPKAEAPTASPQIHHP